MQYECCSISRNRFRFEIRNAPSEMNSTPFQTINLKTLEEQSFYIVQCKDLWRNGRNPPKLLSNFLNNSVTNFLSGQQNVLNSGVTQVNSGPGFFLSGYMYWKMQFHGVFRPFLQKSMNNVMIFIVAWQLEESFDAISLILLCSGSYKRTTLNTIIDFDQTYFKFKTVLRQHQKHLIWWCYPCQIQFEVTKQ